MFTHVLVLAGLLYPRTESGARAAGGLEHYLEDTLGLAADYARLDEFSPFLAAFLPVLGFFVVWVAFAALAQGVYDRLGGDATPSAARLAWLQSAPVFGLCSGTLAGIMWQTKDAPWTSRGPARQTIALIDQLVWVSGGRSNPGPGYLGLMTRAMPFENGSAAENRGTMAISPLAST